jgi:hypothetical protein
MMTSYKKMYFVIIKKIFSKIVRFFYLKDCKRNGMIYGENLRIMSGVDFGSEPYLVEIGKDVVISVDVLFSTHDGGGMRNKKLT